VSSNYGKGLSALIRLLPSRKQNKYQSSLFAPQHDNHIPVYGAKSQNPSIVALSVEMEALYNFQGDSVTERNLTLCMYMCCSSKGKAHPVPKYATVCKAYGI
jgi:hypothetical protein